MNLTIDRIIDAHAHLCDASFDSDLAAVLARAREAGISAIVAVGEDLAEARKNLELAAQHSMIRPAAGLYPTVLSLEQAEEMQAFICSQRDKLVAIGEVGLDYWVVQEESNKGLQRQVFRGFIALAKELNLPLNVHSRSAGRHAIALLLECGATKVQLHAFDGSAAAAQPAVDAGYFFSIPPSIVRSRQKQRLVRKLPLSCLLVETDSPVLGPSPEGRNEPANAIVSIKAIADLKQISEAEVIAAVSQNARRLYGDIQGL